MKETDTGQIQGEVPDSGGHDPSRPISQTNPPRASQFAPGVSGNPAGRPLGSKNAKTVSDELLEKAFAIQEGKLKDFFDNVGVDTTRPITNLEKLIAAQLAKAIGKGDTAAATFILKTSKQFSDNQIPLGNAMIVRIHDDIPE